MEYSAGEIMLVYQIAWRECVPNIQTSAGNMCVPYGGRTKVVKPCEMSYVVFIIPCVSMSTYCMGVVLPILELDERIQKVSGLWYAKCGA